MSNTSIPATLEQGLLHGAPFSETLYEEVLADFVDEMNASVQQDGDDALICLVAEDGEMAMMLIDQHGQLHRNEAARDLLQKMWKHHYATNLQTLFPIFVQALQQKMLAVAGIKLEPLPA